MPNEMIHVTFGCKSHAMAARMIEHFEKEQAEAEKQLSDSLKNPQENGWVEFAPDGSSRPMQEPINAVPFHEAHPGQSAVPANAKGSAPTSYQQAMPQQSSAPMPAQAQAQSSAYAPAPGATPPQNSTYAPPPGAVPPQTSAYAPAPGTSPQASAPLPPPAVPPAAPPMPQQTPLFQPSGQAPQAASVPHNQQASVAPSAAPVISREQLQNALQVFATSADERRIQVRNLLTDFGVNAVYDLPEAAYPNFIVAVRKLGVAI